MGILRALDGNLPATQLMRFLLRKWCQKKIDRRKKRLTTKERRPIARHLGPNGRREYVTSDSQLADCFGWSRPKVARARKAISKYLRFDYRDNACYVSTRDDALIDLWEQIIGKDATKIRESLHRLQARHDQLPEPEKCHRADWSHLYSLRWSLINAEYIYVTAHDLKLCRGDQTAAVLWKRMKFLEKQFGGPGWFKRYDTLGKEIGISEDTVYRKIALLRAWKRLETWHRLRNFRGHNRGLKYATSSR